MSALTFQIDLPRSELRAHAAPPKTLPKFLPLDLNVSAGALGAFRPPIAPPPLRAEEPLVSVARQALLERALDLAELSLNPDEDDLALAHEYAIADATARVRARLLASRITHAAAAKYGVALALVPRFGAGGDGSVALHWRSARVGLMISVPIERDGLIQFYGDTPSGGTRVKGMLADSDPIDFLAEWLASHELPGRGNP